MSADPRVTVLLTAYDQAAYLPDALAGVSAQTFEDWDAVLTDDASTDDSVDLLRRWACECGHPTEVIAHDENLGLNPTLNEAFKHCRGEYLAYLGGDDVWVPDKLARLVAALDAAPEAAVAYSDARVIDAHGHVLHPSFLVEHDHTPPPEGRVFDQLLRRNFVIASSAVFRRAAVEDAGGWDPDLPFEDWDLLLRLADRAPVVHVPGALVDYRVHDASLTRARFSMMLHGRLAILAKWLGDRPDRDAVILDYLRPQSWRLYKVHPDLGRRHVAVAYAGDRSAVGRLRHLVATGPWAEQGFEVLRRGRRQMLRRVRRGDPTVGLRPARGAAYR